jgi:hypothetical protein
MFSYSMIGPVLFQTLGTAMTPISRAVSRHCGTSHTRVSKPSLSLNKLFLFGYVLLSVFKGSSDLSMCRALKRSPNGEAISAQVLLPPSKTSGSQKVSKPQKAERSMQTTCLAQNFHSHMPLSILINRYVLASSIVLLLYSLTTVKLRRDRDSFDPSMYCQPWHYILSRQILLTTI